MSANDMQVGGDHYKNKAIQAWDYIVSNGLGFFEGNIVKYITRYKDKGGIDDLRKARHYLDNLIETENSGQLNEPEGEQQITLKSGWSYLNMSGETVSVRLIEGEGYFYGTGGWTYREDGTSLSCKTRNLILSTGRPPNLDAKEGIATLQDGWWYQRIDGSWHQVFKKDNSRMPFLSEEFIRGTVSRCWYKENGVFGDDAFNLIVESGRQDNPNTEAPAPQDTSDSQDCAKDAPTEFKVGWVYDDGNGSQWFVHFINEDGRYPIRAASLDNGGTYSYTDNGVYLDYEEQSSNNLLLHTGRKYEQYVEKGNNND